MYSMKLRGSSSLPCMLSHPKNPVLHLQRPGTHQLGIRHKLSMSFGTIPSTSLKLTGDYSITSNLQFYGIQRRYTGIIRQLHFLL